MSLSTQQATIAILESDANQNDLKCYESSAAPKERHLNQKSKSSFLKANISTESETFHIVNGTKMLTIEGKKMHLSEPSTFQEIILIYIFGMVFIYLFFATGDQEAFNM